MTVDLRGTRVYRSSLVAVWDYRCRAHAPDPSGEEINLVHSIVLPRSGLFVKHVRGQEVVGDANQVLFFQAGEPYRVSHPVGCGDRCTSFALEPGVLAELISARDPGAMDLRAGPFRRTHAPAAPACDLHHRRLVRALDAGRSPDLGIDEQVLALLDAALAGGHQGSVRSGRADTQRAHRELAESAKIALSGCFRGQVTLDAVARSVHSSPFHLSRVFRSCTGLTMRRYLRRLRVRAALEELAEDPRTDLAALSRRLGFYDQAHFSNAFRCEAGVTPSRWAAERRPADTRRMSRILQD